LDPDGSGQGLMAGSCEYGDELSGSGATELVIKCPLKNVDKINAQYGGRVRHPLMLLNIPPSKLITEFQLNLTMYCIMRPTGLTSNYQSSS
jgi:hypothetical protein